MAKREGLNLSGERGRYWHGRRTPSAKKNDVPRRRH